MVMVMVMVMVPWCAMWALLLSFLGYRKFHGIQLIDDDDWAFERKIRFFRQTGVNKNTQRNGGKIPKKGRNG
jgi:hypothetical protein